MYWWSTERKETRASQVEPQVPLIAMIEGYVDLVGSPERMPSQLEGDACDAAMK